MQFPMTPQQFATLQQRAGIPAEETSGMVEQQGVKAHWSYQDGMLTATILKKPRLVPESFIAGRFKKWAGLT
jgi:hypothetical protein